MGGKNYKILYHGCMVVIFYDNFSLITYAILSLNDIIDSLFINTIIINFY